MLVLNLGFHVPTTLKPYWAWICSFANPDKCGGARLWLQLQRWEQENRGSKASGFLVSLGKNKNGLSPQASPPTKFSRFMISSEWFQLAAQST